MSLIKNTDSRICFVAWGSRINGGVQNLIINLTSEIAVQGKLATIVGFKDCIIIRTLLNRGVDFIFLDFRSLSNKELALHLKNKVVVFTSFSPRLALYRLYYANPIVLYWNVFPTRLKTANKLGSIDITFLTKRLVKYLAVKNGTVFMEYKGWKVSSSILNGEDILLESNYLPIPVKIKEKTNFQKVTSQIKGTINISYVGRGSDWKVKPFIKVIEDINEWKGPKTKIVFHLITQDVETYKRKLDSLRLRPEICIVYQENLSGESYETYMRNNINLHVAMGTSALDGAALGIPTILIDYTMTAMPKNYRYKWIFETKGYDLGGEANAEASNRHVISDILLPFIEDDMLTLKKLSSKCYNYVKDNHDLAIISNSLISYAEQTSCRARTIVNHTAVNYLGIRNLLLLYSSYKNRR